MPRRYAGALVAAALLLAMPVLAWASERSELLVTQGEVAYQQGRYGEARDLFAAAVAADERDAAARYGLGLALGKLGHWEAAATAFEQALRLRPNLEEARRGLALARANAAAAEERTAAALPGAPRPWGIGAAAGFQYDSNVLEAPRGHGLGGVADRGDEGFVLGASGHYDVLNRRDALVRLEYDFYQTLNLHIDDFDFRAQRPRGTASYALRPDLWVGIQGGYNYYTLGEHSYLGEPFAMPFVSFLEGEWGMSQLSYRHGDETYFSRPFDDVRDGRVEAVAANQTFSLGHGRALTMGYQYAEDVPDRRVGNDFEFVSHQGHVGLGFPAYWKTVVDLMYLYRYDDYVHRQSFAGFRKRRHDDEHHMYASVRRPLVPHVNLALVYYGTVNTSNIALFDYRRTAVSGLVEVVY